MGPYGEYGKPIALFEAWEEWSELQEADSKADFPSWLWGPVRRSVWQGYSRIEPQYRRYARIENMPDFRPRLIHGLNALRGFGYVGDHGEYPGMRRTERPGPALVIDTYGGVYQITRQAIINDDSGELLNRNPSEMGYAAGNFVAEAIVALIESNPHGVRRQGLLRQHPYARRTWGRRRCRRTPSPTRSRTWRRSSTTPATGSRSGPRSCS